ncbi:hypothetical protein [Brevundimonas sp. SL130]|uniref:hypothetical protein n=1 Tax=Brevundimonas sp. SL130 TaxID=2995143 RepID=UPI00226D060B|nr:hypothetical protein [Brevundimonas sp. SL130]WAC60302.1 hypothetical protein OU998_02300 [Brevundimonas sp. SL130]
MTDRRKTTAAPPARPSARRPNATGQGVTETLRQALETPAHSDWSRRMLALEHRAPLDLDLDDLRQDRAID